MDEIRVASRRTPPKEDFSTQEKMVILLTLRGYSKRQQALRMHIKVTSLKFLQRSIWRKIPGDMPFNAKVLFWARGATKDQLTGEGWTPLAPGRYVRTAPHFRKRASNDSEQPTEIPIGTEPIRP